MNGHNNTNNTNNNNEFFMMGGGGGGGGYNNTLACLAMKILMRPCHDGAKNDIEQLSEENKTELWSDLTGIENDKFFVDEPQGYVDTCLLMLQQYLKRNGNGSGTDGNGNDGGKGINGSSRNNGFDIASKLYPSYAYNPKFLLKFLRAERYDIEKAGQRIFLHFDIKLSLFGEEKLGREINLSDLSEDDLDSMNRGYLQVLSNPDINGRKVVFYYKAITNCYKYRENILRTAWYVFNTLSQDEMSQKRGIINVVYNNGGYPKGGMDYEKSRRFAQIIRGIPVRFDSFFVCLDDAPWLRVVEAFSFLVDKFVRVRMRALQGSHQECMYQLMALGIPCHSMPVNEDSELLLKYHSYWMQQMRRREGKQQKELQQDASDMMMVDESDDVHPGMWDASSAAMGPALILDE